jgi:hypothetical protein
MSELEKNTTEVEETNKPYTLRRLDGEDLWPVLDIVGKVLPDDLATVFTEIATGEKSAAEVGGVVMFRLVSTVIKDIKKVKDEVYEFLTSVSGLTKDEINALGLMAVPKMIWEIYNAEKNVDFFGDASKSS